MLKVTTQRIMWKKEKSYFLKDIKIDQLVGHSFLTQTSNITIVSLALRINLVLLDLHYIRFQASFKPNKTPLEVVCGRCAVK